MNSIIQKKLKLKRNIHQNARCLLWQNLWQPRMWKTSQVAMSNMYQIVFSIKLLLWTGKHTHSPGNKFMLKVNNINISEWWVIYSKLTLITSERCHWRCYGVLLLTLNTFHTFFYCFYCWLWTCECLLELIDWSTTLISNFWMFENEVILTKILICSDESWHLIIRQNSAFVSLNNLPVSHHVNIMFEFFLCDTFSHL